MLQSISTLPIISSFMKFCLARTFWVELHLGVILEVLQMVGSKFIFYKTCRYLPIGRFTEKIRMIKLLRRRYLTFSTLDKKKKKTRTSRSFKVSNWDILEFRSQKFEIRTFRFLNSMEYGTLNPKSTELSNKIIW